MANPVVYLSELLRVRRELLRLAEKHDADLLQTHILGPLDFLVLSLRGRAKVRRILWTIHSVAFLPARPGYFLGLRRCIARLLYVLLVKRVDGVVAVSAGVRRAVVDTLGRASRDRIVVINNGVDASRYQQLAEGVVRKESELSERMSVHRDGGPLVVTVGRLVEEKGHRYLIRAIPEILETHATAQFVFAGEGASEQILRTLAMRIGCAKNLHFLGCVDNIPELLGMADLFVLPSLQEGMPIALLEAMAAGLPAVATDIAGTREVISSDDVGLLVPPCNVAALAEAISFLLDHPKRATALGSAARQRVATHYSAKQQSAEYRALYNRLLA